MRDTQKKMLEWIETIVTACNGTGASLELLVNYSRENSGQIYVQPTGCFLNIIECEFIFESKFAVFDFEGTGGLNKTSPLPAPAPSNLLQDGNFMKSLRLPTRFATGVQFQRSECWGVFSIDRDRAA